MIFNHVFFPGYQLNLFPLFSAEKWDPQNKGEEIDSCLTAVWQSSIKQEEGYVGTAVFVSFKPESVVVAVHFFSL